MKSSLSSKKGFALATTLVLLTISLVALTTMITVLTRSLKLTRSHAEGLKTFYVSEAGKEYAMWKLSSHNNGGDAVQLAHCLVKDTYCPGGLDEEWSFSIPTDTASTFAVTVVSAEQPGAANISSYGNRTEGTVARRRTKIDAFKPTRQLEPNDQIFDYAISTDEDFWTLVNGSVRVTSQEDEPQKAGIHANDDVNQLLYGRIQVDGPIRAADVLSMPLPYSTNIMTALEYRGASCGFPGCSSMYSSLPTYCFGRNCSGYVGNIPMPGFDINSALPDSFKTIAREYEEDNPGQQHVFNGRELYDLMEAARVSGVNDGWYTTFGPITYVEGDLTVDYGHKLRVMGTLVVQGKITVGVPKRFPIWQCLLPVACEPSTYLKINEDDAVTGLVASNDITFAMYVKDVDINGLIYTPKDFLAFCLFEAQQFTGALIARNYVNYDSLCNPLLSEPMHQQIYDTQKLQLLAQGPRAINNVTTVYSGHWEEEY